MKITRVNMNIGFFIRSNNSAQWAASQTSQQGSHALALPQSGAVCCHDGSIWPAPLSTSRKSMSAATISIFINFIQYSYSLMESKRLRKWHVEAMDASRLSAGWMHRTMFTLEPQTFTSECQLFIDAQSEYFI